jgi:Kef-type K+ transport system membrane component KefB
MSNYDFAHFLLATAHLLVAALAGGYVFERLGQPRVVGEIFGGLLLGPTFLGEFFPDWYGTVFGHDKTLTTLGALNKIGLMLLMFCSGLEIRSEFPKQERKTAAFVTATGTLIPFVAALAIGPFIDFSGHFGPAANDVAFLLVVAVAVAVTSIPVISKIMMDLGILETPFARVVLSAAVVEDVVLYVVLSIALALASPVAGAKQFGLAHLLEIPDGPWSIAYHVGATIVFFVLATTLGPKLFERVSRARFNLVRKSNHLGYLLVFLIGVCGAAMFLEVELMFGAFVAGVVAGASSESPPEHRATAKSFSSAFFVPMFFAMVGWKLNLLRDVPWLFFVAFFAAACALKAASVYLGARWAGVSPRGSKNLAAAMNARGGPGIVLATVALEAKLINQGFYVCLILLAILTSQMAGAWLQKARRSPEPLL